MKNLLIVFSGPSGVGKGTIVKKLLSRGRYILSVSATTRPPRPGEKDGVSYFFTDRKSFEKGIKEGEFLEYSEHFGSLYGTPKKFVESKLKDGDVVLEIDVDGALEVKRAHPEAVLIFILPPSKDELLKRLSKRGSESPEKIRERLARTDYELSKKELYDFQVINDDLDEAVAKIENIISELKN